MLVYVKKVYNIIFYETSPKEFHKFPNSNIHWSKQTTDTGAEIELLQEFFFIPLDIVLKIYENEGIRNKLDAWFIFLCNDNPETIVKLIEEYPEFCPLYEEIYDLCRNTEEVMGMWSKELFELDKNTVTLMLDEMQDEIDAQKAQLVKQSALLEEKDAENARLKVLLKQAGIETE